MTATSSTTRTVTIDSAKQDASGGFTASGLSKSYGQTVALQDVDLEIRPGEQVAFIGPSGSGKTTLLRVLGTQIEPDSGTVEVLGEDPTGLRPSDLRKLRSRIGFVPQSLGLVPKLRVHHNVLNGRIGQRSLFGVLRSLLLPKGEELDELFEILGRVGIEEKIYDRTDTLSGGQQQRVAIARALFQGAQTLLTDEPVSAIDPTRARSALDLMIGLSREDGFTLLVSIHNLELARDLFPRIVGLKQGRVVFDAAPEKVTEAEFTELFRL